MRVMWQVSLSMLTSVWENINMFHKKMKSLQRSRYSVYELAIAICIYIIGKQLLETSL